MFSKKCKEHLRDAKMGRWEHARFALGVAFELKMAVLALVVHAVMPRYFTTYASDKIFDLANRFKEMKDE
jgi:hypothetical protein